MSRFLLSGRSSWDRFSLGCMIDFLELELIMANLKPEIDILIRTYEKRRLFTRG